MKPPKRYPIQIFFLSEDLVESATWLSNKYLIKSITGCMQALVATRFYFVGIRSAKFYKYYFDKCRKQETLDTFFPLWPLKQKPPFNNYSSKTSKWCRMCKEHYEYVKSYLQILLDEYTYRFNKEHGLTRFLEWENLDAPQLKIPEGHLKKIQIPWKNLNPKFRDKNIQLGYRKQYTAILNNYDIKIDDFTKRDIPVFLITDNVQKNKWLE